MLVTDLSMKEVQKLIQLVSEAVVPESNSALSYLRERTTKRRFLETGIGVLDRALHGGLLLGSLTDICGQPGVGKTQFCIGCVVQAHVMGKEGTGNSGTATSYGGVIYIDTEHKFDPIRLVQIATETFPKLFSSTYRSDAAHKVDSLLEAVKVKRPGNCHDFERTMEELQQLAITENVQLIVIDSIAALIRKESLDERQRESFIMKTASELKRLAEACNIAILACNQVTPMLVGGGGGQAGEGFGMADMFGDAIVSGDMTYVPALGATWHHCVTTRLTLSLSSPAGASNVRGKLSVSKSPIAAPQSLEYIIGMRGLQASSL
eukprot:scaffold1084_cov250-Ochromonas_danica.AAC.7